MPPRLVRMAACRVKLRAMTDDVLEVLARLEAGEAPAPRLAWEPDSPLAAVKAWVASRGMKRGGVMAASAALLASYAAHARASGWALESLTAYALGRALSVLGYTRVCQGGVRGFRVDRDTARRMMLHTPLPHRRKQRRRLNARPKRDAVRKPFWPLPHPAARPVVDTLGRVYPAVRTAAECVRVAQPTIQRAVWHGVGAAGVLWRFLTPEEVRCVPTNTLAGDVLPWLSWRRTVSVQPMGQGEVCPACGGRAPQAPLPTPSPQDSPHPPAMGPTGRGVTHTP